MQPPTRGRLALTDHQPPDLVWRKSQRSAYSGDCVEIAMQQDTVHMRHSKSPDGPTLSFTATAWRTFIAAIKDDDPELANP